MQDRVYQTAIHDVDELKQQRLIAVWADMKRDQQLRLLMNGAQGSRRMFVPRDDILNICFVEHKHYFFACLTVCL